MTSFLIKLTFDKSQILQLLCCFVISFTPDWTMAQQDTSYAYKLLDSADVYKPAEPIKAKEFCQEAITIFESELSPIDSFLIRPYSTMGNILDDLAEYDKSIAYHHKSLKICLDSGMNDPYSLGSIYNNLGNVYSTIGQYQKGIDYLHLSDAQYQKRADKRYVKKRSLVLGNIGVAYRIFGKVEKSLNYQRKAIELNNEVSDTININTAINYVNFGVALGDVGRFDEAIYNHEQARKIINELLGETHHYVGICYNNLGLVTNFKGDIDLARDYYTKALDIALSNKEQNLPGVAIAYNNLGVVNRKLGDFDKAIDFFQKSKNINLQIYNEHHKVIGENYSNMASVFVNRGDFEEAKVNFEKAIQIFSNTLTENSLLLGDVYSNLADLENRSGNPLNGVKYIKKSLEISEMSLELDNIYHASKYGILGSTYDDAGLDDKAIEAFTTGEQIYLKYNLSNHPELAGILANKAKVYFNMDEVALGWTNINQAFEILDFNFDQEEYSAKSLIYNETLIYALNALRLRYKEQMKREKPIYRDSLLMVIDHLFAFNEYRIQNAIDPENKRTRLQAAKEQYGLSIQDYLDLELPDKAFDLSDKMKARTLSTGIQRYELANNFNIPDSVTQNEIRLLSKINKHQKNLYQIDIIASDADSLYESEFNKLFLVKLERDEFYAKLKKNHLAYWEQLYEPESLEIEEIQKKLKPDQSYLQYFVETDSSLFAFLINRNDFKVKKIKLDEALSEQILKLKKLINNNESKDEIQILSSILYDQLIQPFENELKFEILITPDGVLSLLPYEILFKEDKYLIEDHCISYHYSTQLWEIMESREVNNKMDLLALAPTFNDFNTEEALEELKRVRSGVTPLLYNQDEAKQIAELWGGEYLSSEKSNLEEFLKLAPEYEILHLATHGKADDRKGEYSYLLLKSDHDTLSQKLFVKDLYDLKLSNKLVVLSACETGIGEVQQGEGIMSMAHGFAMAGSSAIVPTLWSINDKASAEIIVEFFKNLKKGERKNVALRNAKLNFLKNNPDASPFYWAAFIAIGDTQAVKNSFPSSILLLGSGGIFMILFLLSRKRKTRIH